MDAAGTWYTISIWALPAIIAITFHEAAHGFAALRFGDDTALRLGRVTLNPLKHIDPMGTIFLPALLLFLRSPFLFGYAKPVPVKLDADLVARIDRARDPLIPRTAYVRYLLDKALSAEEKNQS